LIQYSSRSLETHNLGASDECKFQLYLYYNKTISKLSTWTQKWTSELIQETGGHKMDKKLTIFESIVHSNDESRFDLNLTRFTQSFVCFTRELNFHHE
jgi:hypothetical protein